MMATVTILVARNDEDIEVEVIGFLEHGDPMTGVRGSVDFESAWVNNKPFELTDDEISKAEEVMMDSIMENIPPWKKKAYNI